MGLFSQKPKQSINSYLPGDCQHVILHRQQIASLSPADQAKFVELLERIDAGTDNEYYIRRRGANGRFAKA